MTSCTICFFLLFLDYLDVGEEAYLHLRKNSFMEVVVVAELKFKNKGASISFTALFSSGIDPRQLVVDDPQADV